jgi:hypothetical protein
MESRSVEAVLGSSERILIATMMPRGVATAVMAFLPASAGVPGTESFPIYALTVITLGVLFMALSPALYRNLSPAEQRLASPSPSTL